MSRKEAIEWLVNNRPEWPENMDKYVTPCLYENWRFVDTLPDREIMFANCLEPAISKAEFELHCMMVTVH